MKQINPKAFRMVPAGIYLGLVWHLSSQVVLVDISGCDKYLHLVEYAVMGALLAYGVGFPFKENKNKLRDFSVFAVLCGAIDEIHQAFVPGRFASFADFLVDIVGCAVGLVVLILIGKFLKKITSI